MVHGLQLLHIYQQKVIRKSKFCWKNTEISTNQKSLKIAELENEFFFFLLIVVLPLPIAVTDKRH